MKRLLTIATCLAIAAAAFAGCGSSGTKTTGTAGTSPSPAVTTTPTATAQQTTPATTSSGSPTAGAANVVEVHMRNIAFAPAQVSAKVGQTIKWTNDDSVDHNVAAMQGASFKSSDFGSGGTYTHKLTAPGTIQYVCTLHPNMTAKITVTK